jgi:glycosyltransferase involved in cell wall biosynthesis
MRRLKVLLSAYACSPRQGSEGGVGWQFARAIAEHHDVWVITEAEKFRDEIERELDAHPELRGRMHFHYLAKRRARRLRKVYPPSYYWFYRQWQRRAYELGRSLHERERFDVVHHLTMVGFREPGYLWRLDAPFVWGPVGGMVQFPWRMLPSMGVLGGLAGAGYNALNAIDMRLLGRPRRAAGRAGACLIAATGEMKRRMLRLWDSPSEIIAEVGQTGQIAPGPSIRREGEPLRLAWCGRHEPRKALPLLLRALATTGADVDWRLDVVGAGPCTRAWQAEAGRLGLNDRIRWCGAVTRDEALKTLRGAHVFVITSLRDLTSTVVLEAISQGLPVVCLDHCGFADVVTDECGLKVPVRNPRQVRADLAAAIETLWRDEDRRRRLAAGALRRSEDFAWSAKAEAINRVYERATGSCA